jgi:hypothetical protein
VTPLVCAECHVAYSPQLVTHVHTERGGRRDLCEHCWSVWLDAEGIVAQATVDSEVTVESEATLDVEPLFDLDFVFDSVFGRRRRRN